MAGTDKASTEATAPVEATPPAGETNEQEFSDAFEEFAAVDDTEPAVAPDPGPKDEEKAGAAAPAETTDGQAASGEESPDDATKEAAPEDIWAKATPEQRAAFEAAQHEVKSNRTRASAQNRKIAELLSVPKPAAPPAAEPAAETPATPETDEDWEKFESDYPEVAGPMAERLGSIRKEIADLKSENADLKGRVTGITDAQTQEAINAEEALLEQRHPDWEQLTGSEAFSAWLPNQPRYVQEGLARNGDAIVDGQEAASLIDLFKRGHAPAPSSEGAKPPEKTPTNGKATRRDRRLESAVQTESGQAGPGAGPPEGDFDAAFDHFARQP